MFVETMANSQPIASQWPIGQLVFRTITFCIVHPIINQMEQIEHRFINLRNHFKNNVQFISVSTAHCSNFRQASMSEVEK